MSIFSYIFHIKLEVLKHATKMREDDLSIFPAQVSCARQVAKIWLRLGELSPHHTIETLKSTTNNWLPLTSLSVKRIVVLKLMYPYGMKIR